MREGEEDSQSPICYKGQVTDWIEALVGCRGAGGQRTATLHARTGGVFSGEGFTESWREKRLWWRVEGVKLVVVVDDWGMLRV